MDETGQVKPAGSIVYARDLSDTLAAIRTQLFNPGDMPNVEKIQAAYKAQPLSAIIPGPVDDADTGVRNS